MKRSGIWRIIPAASVVQPEPRQLTRAEIAALRAKVRNALADTMTPEEIKSGIQASKTAKAAMIRRASARLRGTKTAS